MEKGMTNNPAEEELEGAGQEPESSFEQEPEQAGQPEEGEPEAAPQPEEEPAPEPEANPEEQPEGEPEGESFSRNIPPEAFTYREVADALEEAFGGEEDIVENGVWVATVFRGVIDFTDSEVVYGQNEYWADSGWKPTRRYRCSYSYDSNSHTAARTSDSVEVFVRFLTSEEIAQIEADAAAFAALKEFKAEYDRKATEASYDEALEEFSDLVGIDAYQSVYENRYSYESVDALKDACYLIRGKFALQTKPAGKANVDDKIPAITIDQNGKPEVFEVLSPIEKLHKEYGTKNENNKNIRRN